MSELYEDNTGRLWLMGHGGDTVWEVTERQEEGRGFADLVLADEGGAESWTVPRHDADYFGLGDHD